MYQATHIKLEKKPDNMTEMDWKAYNEMWEEYKDCKAALGVIETMAMDSHPDMVELKELMAEY